jgi:GH15 family glucan-1,4-alpha-glucosidase
MTSAGGGTVAAATTALPERDEQAHDYDYRYAWIRTSAAPATPPR